MKRFAIIAFIFAQIGFFTVCPSLVHAAMMNEEMVQPDVNVSSIEIKQSSVQSEPMECCKEASVHLEQANQPVTPITDSPVIIANESCLIPIVDASTQRDHQTFFCATSPPFHERLLGKRE